MHLCRAQVLTQQVLNSIWAVKYAKKHESALKYGGISIVLCLRHKHTGGGAEGRSSVLVGDKLYMSRRGNGYINDTNKLISEKTCYLWPRI